MEQDTVGLYHLVINYGIENNIPFGKLIGMLGEIPRIMELSADVDGYNAAREVIAVDRIRL